MRPHVGLFFLLSLLFTSSLSAQSNQFDETFWAGKLGVLIRGESSLEQGLLPFNPEHYQFAEDGEGIKYEQLPDRYVNPKSFSYEQVGTDTLVISDLELYSASYRFSASFQAYATERWGGEVAQTMELLWRSSRCNIDRWTVLYGVSGERFEITGETAGGVSLQYSNTFSDVLVVPDRVLNDPDCFWELSERPTREVTSEPDPFVFQYELGNGFSGLQESDFVGRWSIPVWYSIPDGENAGSSNWDNLNQDEFLFSDEQATGLNSERNFRWSFHNNMLVLENDNERYEYTANASRGSYFTATIKRYLEGELTIVASADIAQFNDDVNSETPVMAFLQQDYPMAMGATAGRTAHDFVNGTVTCNGEGFFGFAFLPDGGVASRANCDISFLFNPPLEKYNNLFPFEENTFNFDSISNTLTVNQGVTFSDTRIWKIVDILDERDVLVFERRLFRRDTDGDGEFESSEDWQITQPRLQIYRKMDLSQNKEAWANTDSDNDGLSNPRELELGTDMVNADTDGDGIPDGEEVANGTNPLRDNNIVFVPFDYDGDNKADVGVRRPSTSLQYILNSSDDDIQRVTFGLQEDDIPVSGDFDGDGIADVAVRRPSNYTWYVLNSSDGDIQRIVFGRDSDDIPVPADYDGDGITDVAVRRASNQMWYILNSSDGEIQRIHFGRDSQDIPVPADYDGDGKADVAVRRASSQMWFILNSSDGEIQRIKFGLQEADIPVPADFDGDGKADVAVRRASDRMWYILNSSDDEIQRIKFGLQEADVPIVADYDGDGKADVAVRRPADQMQYILRSSDNMIERIRFGRQSGDIPLAAPVSIKMQMLEQNASQEGDASAPEFSERVLLTAEQ